MVLSIILLRGSISALTNFALVTDNSDVTRLGKGCRQLAELTCWGTYT